MFVQKYLSILVDQHTSVLSLQFIVKVILRIFSLTLFIIWQWSLNFSRTKIFRLYVRMIQLFRLQTSFCKNSRIHGPLFYFHIFIRMYFFVFFFSVKRLSIYRDDYLVKTKQTGKTSPVSLLYRNLFRSPERENLIETTI